MPCTNTVARKSAKKTKNNQIWQKKWKFLKFWASNFCHSKMVHCYSKSFWHILWCVDYLWHLSGWDDANSSKNVTALDSDQNKGSILQI